MNKKIITLAASIVAAIIVALGLNWLTLPAIRVGYGMAWLIAISLIVALFALAIIYSITYDEEDLMSFIKVTASISGIIVVAIIVTGLASSAMFHSDRYRDSVTVVKKTEAEASKQLPDIADVNSICLMDTESAKKLGDRTLGSLTDLVSQYEVGEYYTISYKGQIWKIASLEYGGFFKAMKNDTIPGYILVNPLTYKAEFVKVEEGMSYNPSAYFNEDLLRHARKNHPSAIFGDKCFQIDENGHPYWTITVLDYAVWMGAKSPVGVITVDAVTGESQYYDIAEIPTWIDQVVNGDYVTSLYNRYGQYQNGFWNLSDTGKTMVTDDFGYVESNGDVYIYTGVTSVGNDESNLGFIMVNSRTGEISYYPVAGAEEYSAMSAAEGMVQNFGYKASFPSLVIYKNEPTYVMVLKDDNGLVKKYAMVNMKNYTIVAVEDTFDTCKDSYINLLKKSGNVDIESETEKVEMISEVVVISEINFIAVKGDTVCYIEDVNGRMFKQNFSENELLILLNVGDEITIEYEALDTITAVKVK